MVCDACGTENRAGSRFCDHCGSPLSLSCPACGEPNRADALFCASCGTSMRTDAPRGSAAQPSAERRQVSVLFADLVGFTQYADGRDPERVRALQQQYFDAATEAITRHGGTVEKFIGDAVMAVWGTPVAHEDDAQRAVRAALEIVKAVEALGLDLQARAGVVTAEAAVTLGAINQGMVAGDMVNTAARFQAAADPGQVLADHATVQAAQRTIAFEPIDDLQLKGKAGPSRAWRAVRVQPSRSGDLVEPPFVGRVEELRRLKDALHAVGRDRRIRLVSITGPAGIGKSRLVQELGTYADGLAETIYWHTGRSPSYGEGLAFWALGEMVRRRAGLAEGDDESRTRLLIAATLEEFGVGDEERAWLEAALLALLGFGETGESETLFPAWRTVFERIAQRGATVLVFEDLQWADSGTVEFIEHMLDWSRNQPILIITLARPEVLDRRPGWGTGRSTATAMALEPLSADEMGILLSGILPGMPASLIGTVVGRAEGMPLYAVEMVRALLADGRIERRGEAYEPTGDLTTIPIPASLRSLIASRLDALRPEDRGLVQEASVLGLAFSAEALAAVSGGTAADVKNRLLNLVRRELLEIEADPRSPERGQFRFVQSLIREVAYETLSMRDRRSRHLAAARYLEALESDEAAGALASHYLAAFRASDGPEADAVAVQARISLRAAAERAASLGAHGEAIARLEHALSLTEQPTERAPLLERAAEESIAAGATSGVQYAEQAVAAWREAADAERAGLANALLGEALIYDGRHEDAVRLLGRELEQHTPDRPPEVAARLLSSLARALMRLDRNEEAIEAADRALAVAERLRLDDVVARALINKGAAYVQVGRTREAAALVRGGLSLVAKAGPAREELRAALNLANILVNDEPFASLDVLLGAREKARRLADFWFIVDFTTFISGVRFCIGTADAWQAATDELDSLRAETDNPIGDLWLVAIRISYAIARREPWRELLAIVERAPEIDPANAFSVAAPHYTAAEVALAQGEWQRAAAEGRRAIEHQRFSTQGVAQVIAHAATRTDDRETLTWLQQHLKDPAFIGAQYAAVRARVDGAVLAAEGQPTAALESFASALRTYHDLGLNWEWARTSLDALAAMPGDPTVVGWARDARARFESMGAAAFVALTDDLLTSGDGGSKPPRNESDTLDPLWTPSGKRPPDAAARTVPRRRR